MSSVKSALKNPRLIFILIFIIFILTLTWGFIALNFLIKVEIEVIDLRALFYNLGIYCCMFPSKYNVKHFDMLCPNFHSTQTLCFPFWFLF